MLYVAGLCYVAFNTPPQSGVSPWKTSVQDVETWRPPTTTTDVEKNTETVAPQENYDMQNLSYAQQVAVSGGQAATLPAFSSINHQGIGAAKVD